MHIPVDQNPFARDSLVLSGHLIIQKVANDASNFCQCMHETGLSLVGINEYASMRLIYVM